MIELVRIAQLCPRSRPPLLLLTSIRIQTFPIPTRDDTHGRRVEDLVLGVGEVGAVHDEPALESRVVVCEGVAGIETDEVGEVTMGVGGRV